jgi:hypothetical protein
MGAQQNDRKEQKNDEVSLGKVHPGINVRFIQVSLGKVHRVAIICPKAGPFQTKSIHIN